MQDLYKLYRKEALDTSIEAAESIYLDLKALQTIVFGYAKTRKDGFTDEEMNTYFDTHRSTFRARRSELVAKGIIVDSGKRRKMTNGRNATVWILADYQQPSVANQQYTNVFPSNQQVSI